jgi:hypothetical protein
MNPIYILILLALVLCVGIIIYFIRLLMIKTNITRNISSIRHSQSVSELLQKVEYNTQMLNMNKSRISDTEKDVVSIDSKIRSNRLAILRNDTHIGTSGVKKIKDDVKQIQQKTNNNSNKNAELSGKYLELLNISNGFRARFANIDDDILNNSNANSDLTTQYSGLLHDIDTSNVKFQNKFSNIDFDLSTFGNYIGTTDISMGDLDGKYAELLGMRSNFEYRFETIDTDMALLVGSNQSFQGMFNNYGSDIIYNSNTNSELRTQYNGLLSDIVESNLNFKSSFESIDTDMALLVGSNQRFQGMFNNYGSGIINNSNVNSQLTESNINFKNSFESIEQSISSNSNAILGLLEQYQLLSSSVDPPAVTAGSTAGGSTAGSTAGGSTTGSTAGGSTAGGSTAGSTAGGSTGGSTAGSTAGGSTAGSTAGGSTAGSDPLVAEFNSVERFIESREPFTESSSIFRGRNKQTWTSSRNGTILVCVQGGRGGNNGASGGECGWIEVNISVTTGVIYDIIIATSGTNGSGRNGSGGGGASGLFDPVTQKWLVMAGGGGGSGAPGEGNNGAGGAGGKSSSGWSGANGSGGRGATINQAGSGQLVNGARMHGVSGNLHEGGNGATEGGYIEGGYGIGKGGFGGVGGGDYVGGGGGGGWFGGGGGSVNNNGHGTGGGGGSSYYDATNANIILSTQSTEKYNDITDGYLKITYLVTL